jgi:hypothetical protein
LDTVNAGFIIYFLWYYVIDQFGQPQMTTHLSWAFPVQILVAVSV